MQECSVLEAAMLLLLMSVGEFNFFLHESLFARSQIARESILPMHVLAPFYSCYPEVNYLTGRGHQ